MRKVIIGMSIAAISLMAVDYSQMTMEELTTLRGTIAVEERDAFKAEMQSRMQAMTPEERASYRADRGNAQGARDGSGQGRMNKGSDYKGQGVKQRLRDGSGAGSMNQGAGGQGRGHQ
jgi:hypothetical protein